MRAIKVTELVETELTREVSFQNSHGITRENVRTFLCPPLRAEVGLDRAEPGSPTSPMWIVLLLNDSSGYGIAWDEKDNQWCVIERSENGQFSEIVAASTLFEALGAM